MERRNTIQKELILNAVIKMHRHVTADEVYEFIKADYPSIGKGTVYRNLGLLAEENKIRKVEIPDGPVRYDFRLEKHFHLRCVQCGKIVDVDLKDVPDMETYAKAAADMLLLDYEVFFKGLCPDCKKKEQHP